MLIDYLFCNFKELLGEIIQQQKIAEILFYIIMYFRDFNVLIDGKSFFDLLVKNEEKTYEKIIDMSNKNDYATGNLLGFTYFKENYK